MAYHTIHHHHHFGWDNALSPLLTVAPGDTVEFAVLEASGGRIHPGSEAADLRNLDAAFANPTTGPVFVDGAEPGDTLAVEILDVGISNWGWTAIIPGFGLLAEDFPDPFLHHSQYSEKFIAFTPEIHIPTRPFPGTIGVAPAEPGWHSAIPPLASGGNLDCKDIVPGARLYLPVQVPGALFSVGDTHAAQGDGEVCGTAVESPMNIRLRFSLRKQQHLKFPRLALPNGAIARQKGSFVTMGIGDLLMNAARDAVREMIDHLTAEYALSPELAYCLCSLAVDLKISEVVNAPNWVVCAYLSQEVFR